MSPRLVTLALAALLAAAFCPSAGAQMGASSPDAGAGAPGHGWVVIPADSDGFTLWHLPPRAGMATGPSAARRRGVPSGTLRIVSRLVEPPEALAAWAGEVWLIGRRTAAPRDDGTLRPVYRVETHRGPIGPGWHYGEGARLQTEPPLLHGGALIDAAGADSGLHVLLESGAGAPELWRLAPTGWVQVALPPDDHLAGSGAAAGLIAVREGVGLWVESGPESELVLWTSLPASRIDDAPRDSVDWLRRSLGADVKLRDSTRLWSVAGRVIASEWLSPSALRIRDLSCQPPVQIAHIDGLDAATAIAALDASRRIVAVWRDPENEAASAPWNPRRILEISTDDGAALYDGLATSPGPVSPAEFKLLALALVVTSAAALVFIIRSDDGVRAIELPPSAALAPAPTRIIAGAIDIIIFWLIASGGFGLTSPDALAVVLGGVRLDFAPLLWTLGAGWVIGSLSEWLLGRTPGKWLAGCAVVSVRPADRKRAGRLAPHFWQAVARNAVKYPLAPIALLGLASPTLRHRGDTLAGTAVIIHLAPEAPGE